MDSIFPNPSNTSSELPPEVKKIRPVNRFNNQYEDMAIMKEGYKLLEGSPRLGNEKAGYITHWVHPNRPGALMFLKKPDGFYYYAGKIGPSKNKK